MRGIGQQRSIGLKQLLDSSGGDFACIAKQFGVDKARLSAELTRSLDKLKSGNARTPALSPYLLKMLTEAWTLGSIDFGAGQIRTGFAVLALCTNEELARLTRGDKLDLARLLLDAVEDEEVGLTDEQLADLQLRIAEFEKDPDEGRPWEEVKAELERDE